MAFSTRFEIARDSFISSTSAVTGLKLSNTTSIFRVAAIGRSRFRIFSTRVFIFSDLIFSVFAVLSILTRDSRSLMILFSLSISSDKSPMNSLYNSAGTSSCVRRESASTFMEVRGVFSSWDTLETNSFLESSRTLILPSILLNASEISCVSV